MLQDVNTHIFSCRMEKAVRFIESIEIKAFPSNAQNYAVTF